ncbi:MAG: hypothetical protein AAF539_00115, partial [Planctomycetota bacterium]
MLSSGRQALGGHGLEPGESPQRGSLRLEMLEKRQMMAGDVDLLFTDGAGQAASDSVATASDDSSTTNRTPSGEPAVDLVQFAQDLDAAGVEFYGADWCPACTDQKDL